MKDLISVTEGEDLTVIIKISLMSFNASAVAAYHCRRCHRTIEAKNGVPPIKCGDCDRENYHLLAANAEVKRDCDMCKLIVKAHGGVKRMKFGPKGK